ncbi:TPA: ABC transporter substrate-binding protein, partial [Pseudomonas aeruginosa]|nr:ABC transporter substrate-binding protein [Pseudomonas aeruginosa]HCD9752434.1 ABC transporter substrate-binding protein [Pseudomonas aeruginosa]HCR1571683.1 ABC transporter substrate-binding protein [Pseudomonas aeruginosa]HCW3401793.1 ABC transporter substrate-binding protein [Pseudomonas aeruginosa]HCW3419173.1 ABC transporter substrate-binding protein [Pseudomonas aeruginosa]
MTQYNPFIHGYTDFRIERTLQITYEDDCPPCYRALHPSQQILSDTQLQCFPCIFNDDFALVTEGREIDTALSDRCPYNGLVRNVLYGILAEQDGQQKHIGDLYSLAEAQSVVRHLSFGGG